MQHQQAPIRPLTCRIFNVNGEGMVEIGLGRDVTVTFRRERIVLLEVNGLQFAPIGTHIHDEWFKSLVHGGLEPVMKDAPEIDAMVMNYLFEAAILTRLGEKDA